MAKVYNIMNKLTNERPILEIDEDHQYKINNSKNNAIYIQSLVKNKDKQQGNEIELLDKIIKSSLPKEAFEYIESLELSLDSYNTIVKAIMAAISNLELDEVDKLSKKEAERFQENEE